MIDAPYGSSEFFRQGCRDLDRRICAVHLDDVVSMPSLRPGEAIVTCFVTWRWFDIYWRRNRLNRKVWEWLEENKPVSIKFELRFVENFK